MNTQRRRFFVPQVVQTSSMDCGPAALKCLCEGWGIHVGYGRLREACQTDVDGTSIDTLEAVAMALGLDAEQMMLPHDYLFSQQAQIWPALVVVRQADGNTHFVVVWRSLGRWLHVMDPAVGRRWVTRQQFMKEIYAHAVAVNANHYCEWATSPEPLNVLNGRLRRLGMDQAKTEDVLTATAGCTNWQVLAKLDAAARMTSALVEAGALRVGVEASHVFQTLTNGGASAIPDRYWSVTPKDQCVHNDVWLRGAVLLRVKGKASAIAADAIPPMLNTALKEAEPPAFRTLVRLLHEGAQSGWVLLVGAITFLAAGLVLEALLLRALLSVGDTLGLTTQRLQLLSAIAIFASILLALEVFIAQGAMRLGRQLELRLRVALLRKIPLLHDSYFQSRLSSDMAERSHNTHLLRGLPILVSQSLRALMLMSLTVVGIICLDPASALTALLMLVAAVTLPILAQSVLAERELRERTQAGGLARFYLDAFLGLTAIRAHSAERSFARQFESRMTQWGRAALAFGRAGVYVESVSMLCGLLLAAFLLRTYIGEGGDLAAVLLLAYWAMQLPSLGQELVLSARHLVAQQNVAKRLLEPLTAPEEPFFSISPRVSANDPTVALATAITFDSVSVRVAGHAVLEDCSFSVQPGEHIAIVGVSGAGKSTLVGLLLGWYRPASGEVRVNGRTLTAHVQAELRAHTAWIDPAVQLWNRSVLANVRYCIEPTVPVDMAHVMRESQLQDALVRLPEGLQTLLGEGAARLSGGEGQRLRLARALAQCDAHLVILDEPFRGLDREQRRQLLTVVREHWSEQTLLCVTHDLAETQHFSRVLVIENGRIVEDDAPSVLTARATSRYRALLEADERIRQYTWQGALWRKLRLVDGRLQSGPMSGKRLTTRTKGRVRA